METALRIEMPEGAEEIISRLKGRGYEAFAVGGCVRDSIMGRTPEDWDITTSALPAQVKEVFRRTIDTGIQHGTVTVMKGGIGYEVTTYRIDGEYRDGRHPSSVSFTSNLREDLRRRDFTINAMAYSHETGLVDAFGGLEDMKAGRIRCVGDPVERFTEDALRILRAIRFSAQLDFSIEDETLKAITTMAPNLAKVSRERVQTELTKLLLSPHPEKIRQVYDTGISPYVSEAFHRLNLENLQVNGRLPKKKHVRWGVFLKDASSTDAVQILRDLKLDNDTINRVRVLNQWINQPVCPDEKEIRRAMSAMEPSLFDDLLDIWEILGKTEEEQEQAGMRRETSGIIRRRGDCVSLKELAVSGRDLMDAGMKPGKAVGAMLQYLLSQVLEEPEQNKKETLLALAARRNEFSGPDDGG